MTKAKTYGVFYLHYSLHTTQTLKEANAYAKKMEKDPEILHDMSQRDLIGPASDYITVSDVTGQDI